MGSYKSVKWLEGLTPVELRSLTRKLKEKYKIKNQQKEAKRNIELMTGKWRGEEVSRKIKRMFDY